MQIEQVAIASIALDPANVRRHPERNLESIKASLRRFGQQKPIVVDADGVVLAGNGTLAAARELGWDTIAVVRTPLRGAEARAYAVADNRSAELAEWDDAALASLLDELREADETLLDAAGFTGDEADELLASLAAAVQAPAEPAATREDPGAQHDRTAELFAKWRVEPGQLWEAGRHRLLCGDSTKLRDIARVLAGDAADLLLTDPPYGIDIVHTGLGSGKQEFHRGNWDKVRPPIGHLLAVAPKAIVWGGNYFPDELPVSKDWLCWHKKNDGLIFSEFELAWTNLGNNCRHLSHHWSGEKKNHPTQKPLPVIAWCLSLVDSARIVLDAFAGSGTTIVASEQAGRSCRAIEIDPKYCSVILERLSGMGLSPRLAD